MDEKKIQEFLQQAYPKLKVIEDAEGTYAESDAPDVDVKSSSLGAWKKFATPATEKPMAADSQNSDLRELFRVRKLKGTGPAHSGSERRDRLDVTQPSGKLALKRLVPGTASDDTEDTLDVLVDEEHGIIGESDSGPDDK